MDDPSSITHEYACGCRAVTKWENGRRIFLEKVTCPDPTHSWNERGLVITIRNLPHS